MQITKVEVIPFELALHQPVQIAHAPPIENVIAVFVRFETRGGLSGWGCTVVHADLVGEDPTRVIETCHECADRVPDLHPTNLEYSLAELAPLVEETPSALCAFDIAFHDLLGQIAGLPLYRILGGYRNRIQTSITLPLAPVYETVEMAKQRVSQGFRILKVKGGVDAEQDVQRVKAVHRIFPNLTLRLDADGGYDIREALHVARALVDKVEMIEQPTPEGDIAALSEVSRLSPIRILADQSVKTVDSAFQIASQHAADGISIKVATCGGIRPAKQIDTIARAAKLTTMVSCLVEPSLLIAAGLGVALSSPNVLYGDLDGYLYLENDPSLPAFRLEGGCLIASEEPGLGCSIDLG